MLAGERRRSLAPFVNIDGVDLIGWLPWIVLPGGTNGRVT